MKWFLIAIVLILLYFFLKGKPKKNRLEEQFDPSDFNLSVSLETSESTISTGNFFLDQARLSEKEGDYLGARVSYMKWVGDVKRSGAAEKELQYATQEYEGFVKRDPVFQALIDKLLPFLQANPGLLQSEISKHFQSTDWPSLYNYDRPVSKDDIYYALYFADKFGMIRRVKKGRSYELYVAEESKDFLLP